MKDAFDIVPATPDRWADVERLFGARGACAGCWCMFFKLPKAEYDAQRGAGNKRAFRKIVASGQVPGLIALADGEPVGWCAVEPREAYSRITRSRSLQPLDERPAWAITCFFVARPWRRKGVSVALQRAAAQHAREHGAPVIEGYPVEPKTAGAFWDGALGAAARGERIILGAWDGEVLAGTVSLLLDCPPNQPHRAEIAKLMTRPSHRGRGVATALMRAAESRAVERARTLLVLDTAADGGASRVYEKLGFILAGIIPDYALKPHGGLTGTMVYWKRI